MGIPYSKQINAAFDQVTPLVAAGFEVLQTTKNVSILLAAIQVCTVILLGFILAALMALLITINPELDAERKEIVTPAMKWLSSWLMPGYEGRTGLWALLWILAVAATIGGVAGFWATSTDIKEQAAPESEGPGQHDGDAAEGAKADGDAEK